MRITRALLKCILCTPYSVFTDNCCLEAQCKRCQINAKHAVSHVVFVSIVDDGFTLRINCIEKKQRVPCPITESPIGLH
jgi:hypothetical protein